MWNYTGLNAEEMEERISTVFERNLTKIHINVDRTKAVESGFTQLDVANSVVTQAPQFTIASLSDLRNIPIFVIIGIGIGRNRPAGNSG